MFEYVQKKKYGYLTYDEAKAPVLWRVIEEWRLPSGDPMVTLRAGDITLIEYAEAFWPMSEF